MATVAISRIQYGNPKGEVELIVPGDDISDLPEEVQESLVLGGSAVETGKSRKFSVAPGVGAPRDEETLLRDKLIAESESGVDDDVVPAKTKAANKEAAAKTPGGASAQNPMPKPE